MADIPKPYFEKNKVIYGKIIRVIDGDTVRVRHCATRFSEGSLGTKKKRIHDSTMSIRIYGVDAPELQKRKSDPSSQPFAKEAKELTSNLCLGKKVSLKLLRLDQYGRAVAKVQTRRSLKAFPPFSKKDLSIELARRGFATLYTGRGAEYDGNKELLESKQKKAKRKGRGVWSDANYVLPAEFKRKHKR